MRALQNLTALIFLLCLATAQAAPSLIPSPPRLAASGYILMDYQSGQALAESNADERMEPASLTKMMTAYTVFQEINAGHIHLNDEVLVSEKAWRMKGSRMFIEVGSKVSVEELLKGMIIQSGNDASVALAEFVAGSEDAFVMLMNANAKTLGLNGTHFVNSTGLPAAEHFTTPRDMARLASALIRNYPDHYSWYSEKKYTYNNITQSNRNLLLYRDESVDGVKTGHTESAGYCLVASAKRDDMRLVSVVMGTNSEKARAQESQKLLNYGFRFFETHRLYAAGETLKQMRIWKGATESLPLGLSEELFVTVPRGQYQDLKASVSVDKNIIAPASKGQAFGTVNINLGEKMLAQRPLVALQDVEEGSLWQQVTDQIMLMFQ